MKRQVKRYSSRGTGKLNKEEKSGGSLWLVLEAKVGFAYNLVLQQHIAGALGDDFT